ncbi:MAG: class IV adenylate cyclase [Phycisphaerales bacterium]|nr:MAG: class IV adenylate cyclase [Phycisphaerales bacterium]
MGINIEIKARAANVAHQRDLASRISETPCERIEQVDTFFEVPHGELKLREFAPNRGELIHYHRRCQSAPKRSDYSIVSTSEPVALREMLARALPTRGVVSKDRYLYLVGRTRIHFDDVAGIGWFIELEAVLLPGQSEESGRATVTDLMSRLEVRDADLIECAYIDLLTADGSGHPR